MLVSQNEIIVFEKTNIFPRIYFDLQAIPFLKFIKKTH